MTLATVKCSDYSDELFCVAMIISHQDSVKTSRPDLTDHAKRSVITVEDSEEEL